MKAIRIILNNETRIQIDFPYNKEIASQIKQLSDARWSNTIKAWHIPYTKEAFDGLMIMFPNIEIEKQKTSQPDAETINQTPTSSTTPISNEVKIEIIDYKKIFLRFPYAKEHIAKMKTIPYYYWHKEEKQ